jgi:hypothetical protein
MFQLCRDSGRSRTPVVGMKRGGGGERIEGTVTSPTEGEIKESVTYFYVSLVHRKAVIMSRVSRFGTGNTGT